MAILLEVWGKGRAAPTLNIEFKIASVDDFRKLLSKNECFEIDQSALTSPYLKYDENDF